MKLRLMLSPKPVLKVIVPLSSLMPPPCLSLSDDNFWGFYMNTTGLYKFSWLCCRNFLAQGREEWTHATHQRSAQVQENTRVFFNILTPEGSLMLPRGDCWKGSFCCMAVGNLPPDEPSPGLVPVFKLPLNELFPRELPRVLPPSKLFPREPPPSCSVPKDPPIDGPAPKERPSGAKAPSPFSGAKLAPRGYQKQ